MRKLIAALIGILSMTFWFAGAANAASSAGSHVTCQVSTEWYFEPTQATVTYYAPLCASAQAYATFYSLFDHTSGASAGRINSPWGTQWTNTFPFTPTAGLCLAGQLGYGPTSGLTGAAVNTGADAAITLEWHWTSSTAAGNSTEQHIIPLETGLSTCPYYQYLPGVAVIQANYAGASAS